MTRRDDEAAASPETSAGTAPREIELKLTLEPDRAADLLTHPRLAALADVAPKSLRSVYYDTPDHALAAAEASLRVRADGSGYVQTVKAGGGASGGLFDRDEWEVAVEGPRPSDAALKGTPAKKILGRKGVRALRPLFTTVMERVSGEVAVGASRVTVSVDRGRVEDGAGGSLPLCEVELELESGGPGDLFVLARELADTVPLRPGVRSKSERGYALVEGALDAVAKAEPIPLEPDVTTATGFRAVAQGCLRHLGLNEAALLERRPEALHQTRVALRRLRAALWLFREVVADVQFESIKAELKGLIGPLGRARDLDVFLGVTLPAEQERRPDEPGLTDLARRVAVERERAYDAVLALVASAEWRGFLLDLVAWVAAGPWLLAEDEASVRRRERPLAAFAGEALADLRRQVARRGRHLARLEPPARHRVRIKAKRLRYAAEFVAALYDKPKARRRHARFVATLSVLQDDLGALNDLATGHALAAELVASLPPARGAEGEPAPPATLFAAGVVAADQDGRADALLARAEAAHAAFRDARRFWR